MFFNHCAGARLKIFFENERTYYPQTMCRCRADARSRDRQSKHVIPLHTSRWQQTDNCFDFETGELVVRQVAVTVALCARATTQWQ